MPILTAGVAGNVQVSGISATVATILTADIADPVIVYGIPAQLPTPPPTTSPVPDTVRARVLTAAGVFIAHLPHAKGIRILDEHNTAGSGSVDIRRYDDLEDAYPTIWNPTNQVMVSLGDLDIFRILLDSEPGYRVDPDTGERWDTNAGLGQLGVLNSGMIFPEYGFHAEGTEERSFDYGSNPTIGGWLVPSEWITPVGKLVRSSWRWTYKRRHYPKGWPDRRAQWLWWTNPDSTSVPNETCYFRSSFTLTGPTRVKFWVAGDDTLEFQVDGEVRVTNGPGGWHKPSTVVLTLGAGTHYVAAKVTNSPSSDGSKNRSGFICSIGKINGDGDVLKWLRRTTPSSWTMRRARSAPPGWFPAQVFLQLVTEQKARLCAGHAGITFGFTTTHDSRGLPWLTRSDQALTVGTLGLDYTQQLVEAGLDIAMSPSLRLDCWLTRGIDRSAYVRLDQGKTNDATPTAGPVRPTQESASQLPGIRNALYAKAKTGWAGVSNAASIAAHGLRESLSTIGSSRSASQTTRTLNQLLPDLADPPQTIEYQLSGAAGPQPYIDFNVADWVSARPAGHTTWSRFQVMSVSMEVTETGLPDWTLQLYED